MTDPLVPDLPAVDVDAVPALVPGGPGKLYTWFPDPDSKAGGVYKELDQDAVLRFAFEILMSRIAQVPQTRTVRAF